MASNLNNIFSIQSQLYSCVADGSFELAEHLTKSLLESNDAEKICYVLDRLLRVGVKNVLNYAYQLWTIHKKEVVYRTFSFQFLLHGDYVKITNKLEGFLLKMTSNINKTGYNYVNGVSQDRSSNSLRWKFIPVWESNEIYFKIFNITEQRFLSAVTETDGTGDRRVFGSLEANTDRHQWYLKPLVVEELLWFYIYNRRYSRALKLGKWTNSEGDHILWVHNSPVNTDPEEFGWKIEAW